MADSDVIGGIENLTDAVSGETPSYEYKNPNTDIMKAISKCVDAADGTIGSEYHYNNPNTDVIQKMDELADAIATHSGGGGTPVYTVYSKDIPLETNTSDTAVINGGIYLFSTVYHDRDFTGGCEIIAGSTGKAYGAAGLGRAWAVVRATSSTISYPWYGEICPTLYNRIEFKKDGTNIDDKIVIKEFPITASNSFNSDIGKLYLIGTANNDIDGTFTGANIVCHNILGNYEYNRDYTAFFIIQATSQTVSYSKNIVYMYKFEIGENIIR